MTDIWVGLYLFHKYFFFKHFLDWQCKHLNTILPRSAREGMKLLQKILSSTVSISGFTKIERFLEGIMEGTLKSSLALKKMNAISQPLNYFLFLEGRIKDRFLWLMLLPSQIHLEQKIHSSECHLYRYYSPWICRGTISTITEVSFVYQSY